MYDQHKAQNSLDTIVPELATSWAWSADNTELTFKLREGVKWHDGKPFTAKDVKCTFDLLQGKAQDKFRKNPRKDLVRNIVTDVTANGDFEVTFHLKRPQPSLLAMLASGYTPIYPCHVPPAQMRTHPIGTGPFKFVEFKQNESIKLDEQSGLLEEGPALSRRHRIHHHPEPLDRGARLRRRQVRHDLPDRDDGAAAEGHQSAGRRTAICEIEPINVSTNLIVNRDNAAVRQSRTAQGDGAGARPQGVHRHHVRRGRAIIGGAHAAAAGRRLGHAAGYAQDHPGLRRREEEPRAKPAPIMKKLGYGPDKRLKIKVSTRNLATYRDPAVILIDQLKEIYIDGELDPVETGNWFAKVARKDYSVGLNLTGNGVDDPDQAFYENYACGSERNYTHYCNKDLQKLFDQQSAETDRRKAQEAGLGDRQEAAGGRGAADPLPRPGRHLLAALRQGHDDHDQQLLQRLPLRGRLAGQIRSLSAQTRRPGR